MNEQILNDFLARHEQSQNRLISQIEAMVLAIQQNESEKTPQIIRPTTLNLTAATTGQINSQQILRKDASRRQVILFNQGTGDLLWSPNQFDPLSMMSQFSDPAHPTTVLPMPNQAVPIGFLPSGATITIIGTDAIWAYNVATFCVLSMTESIYANPRNPKSPTFPVPGVDGAIGAGYGFAPGVDGNPVVMKGLR
jgi:hypothetical protein